MKIYKTLTALTCSVAFSSMAAQADENPHDFEPIGAATEVRADLVPQKKVADANGNNNMGKPAKPKTPPEGECGEDKCGKKPPEGNCGEDKCGKTPPKKTPKKNAKSANSNKNASSNKNSNSNKNK